MKANYLLMLFIIFIFCSCEKDNKSNNLDKNPPKAPETENYDLNDDLLDDIKIEYSWFTWDGINSSGGGISGLIEPLNGSSILLKRDEYPLFNKLNDTIKVNTNEPYYWEKYLFPYLVTISTSSLYGNSWPNEWKIQSNMSLDSYYLGIKINKDNSNQIGWIKIKINQSNGGIQILDKKFTKGEFIIIGK